MERESFEDEEIGKILSDNFVCIKLDREERPDVDKVYMTFVQVAAFLMFVLYLALLTGASLMFVPMNVFKEISGSGGWPMNVWLTPDLRPFIGGTYFPPRDHGRRPGLKTVLMRIIDQVQKMFFLSQYFDFIVFVTVSCEPCLQYLNIKTIPVSSQWRNNRPAVESNGNKILEALKKGTAIASDAGSSPPFAPDVTKRCFQQLANSYEEEYGGFREAPKFPSPGNLKNRVEMWLWAPCLTPSVASQ